VTPFALPWITVDSPEVHCPAGVHRVELGLDILVMGRVGACWAGCGPTERERVGWSGPKGREGAGLLEENVFFSNMLNGAEFI